VPPSEHGNCCKPHFVEPQKTGRRAYLNDGHLLTASSALGRVIGTVDRQLNSANLLLSRLFRYVCRATSWGWWPSTCGDMTLRQPRDPSGRSRRFLSSAEQGYSAAEAGCLTDRMRREISPQAFVVSLGCSGWAFVLAGLRSTVAAKGNCSREGEESAVGCESRKLQRRRCLAARLVACI
jgi:hypothetical protein